MSVKTVKATAKALANENIRILAIGLVAGGILLLLDRVEAPGFTSTIVLVLLGVFVFLRRVYRGTPFSPAPQDAEASQRRAAAIEALKRESLTPSTTAAMGTDNASLLIPIGHCIGAHHDLPVPVSTDYLFEVRVGPDVHRLSDEQFAIWGLAHGTPDRDTERPWGRQAVLDAARRAGITKAEQVLASLTADHLLVETTPGTDGAVDFARRHRLIPLMLGLGNTVEEPWIYSAGMIDLPIVQMSAMAYDLYEWAHMDANLWLACEGAAATAVGVGIEDPLATDPLAMLNALLGTLHVLLSPNAVYLDSRLAN